MEALDKKYIVALDNIKSTIQNSELLTAYLDEEEEEDYNALRTSFLPSIQELYEKAAAENPLQLEAFESHLFDEGFEGLYLPRILGYSVLRGETNERVKYIRPQNHFKNVLLAVCNSNNFDLLRKRIGQSIQVGFALSSDIWITNLVESISNKTVKQFLLSQKLEKYRDFVVRRTGLTKYKKQFESLNYQTAQFPSTSAELAILAASLKTFLIYRTEKGFDNESIMPHIETFLGNKDFYQKREFLELTILIAKSFTHSKSLSKSLVSVMDQFRSSYPDFNNEFFHILNDLIEEGVANSQAASERLSSTVTRTSNDELTEYFNLLDIIHAKGYVHEDSLEATRKYYDNHEGLSIQNECLRNTLLNYFAIFMRNLPLDDYAEYFEINKTFVAYISIFSNQEFNQAVKEISLVYVKKLKKKYTDKRARDYQDIKKFVRTTFVDLGFFKEKQVVEFFKTKRKKKV